MIGLMLLNMAYGATIPMPAPVVFKFVYDGSPVGGLNVDIFLNDVKITRETNRFGAIQVDVGAGSPDFSNAKTIDLRYAKLKLECGMEVCNKEYNVDDLDTPYWVTFEMTNLPSCSYTCPECNCGSCSGGGGCQCKPCETTCEETVCPAVPTCPDEKVCPECPATQDCTPEQCADVTGDCPEPEGQNIGAILIALIGGLGAGGLGGIYFTKNKALGKNGGIKIYMGTNGEEKTLHKHPGIVGYHDPATSHRDPKEKHPAGQLLPQYEKDASGKWVYVK